MIHWVWLDIGPSVKPTAQAYVVHRCHPEEVDGASGQHGLGRGPRVVNRPSPAMAWAWRSWMLTSPGLSVAYPMSVGVRCSTIESGFGPCSFVSHYCSLWLSWLWVSIGCQCLDSLSFSLPPLRRKKHTHTNEKVDHGQSEPNNSAV